MYGICRIRDIHDIQKTGRTGHTGYQPPYSKLPRRAHHPLSCTQPSCQRTQPSPSIIPYPHFPPDLPAVPDASIGPPFHRNHPPHRSLHPCRPKAESTRARITCTAARPALKRPQTPRDQSAVSSGIDRGLPAGLRHADTRGRRGPYRWRSLRRRFWGGHLLVS
jgi:hypothetical protein